MILESLKLRCYRNLAGVDLAWNEHFNVIYGQNAQGKTNLLEAIYLLGHLKSFRAARGQDLINHTAEKAWVGAVIKKGGVIHNLEIGLQKNGRNPRVDGKTVQKLSQFLGYFRTVLFTPEELANIKGFPARWSRFNTVARASPSALRVNTELYTESKILLDIKIEI